MDEISGVKIVQSKVFKSGKIGVCENMRKELFRKICQDAGLRFQNWCYGCGRTRREVLGCGLARSGFKSQHAQVSRPSLK